MFQPFSQYDAGAHRDGAASGLELVETALPKSVQTFQELVLATSLVGCDIRYNQHSCQPKNDRGTSLQAVARWPKPQLPQAIHLHLD